MRSRSPYLLAALLTTTGLLHFLIPRTFDAIVPAALPAKRALTYGSGLAELACAAAVAYLPTRRRGALATAALFVAVFPANIQMALDAHGPLAKALAYARLPLQVPLVWWALQVARTARIPDPPRPS